MKHMNYDPSAVPMHQNLAQGKDIGKYGKLSGGAGDFGMSPHLGGRQEVKCPDANRRFSELSDAQRCCAPPRGSKQSSSGSNHGSY